MITIKLNDKGKPEAILNKKPKSNIVTLPDLDDIFDEVNDRSELECDYSDLLGGRFGVLKDLLNSNNAILVELGRDFLSMIIESYGDLGEYELPNNAAELIEFVLTKSDTNTIL